VPQRGQLSDEARRYGAADNTGLTSGPGAALGPARGGVIGVLCRMGHDGRVRVLVVEDNEVVAQAVAEGLRDQGIAVDGAGAGAAGLVKAGLAPYDVIVLDRDLPVVQGDDVCARLAGRHDGARVLMLTAAGAPDDRVDGLNLGADDYLAKPFHFPELVARVRALGRRAASAPPVLRRGELALDRARRRASRNGQPVPLNRKELGVLEVLMSADGAVISAEQLLDRVWDEFADPFTNAVAVTVMRLRRKLGDPPLIETVIGGGYRLP
jgi:DNA-binding response OmpR family regulator